MGMDRLLEKIAALQNPTVAGLDPKLSYIPEHIRAASYEKYGRTLEGAADALLAYNKGLIDALCDIVPAVKPQAAYYEMYGWQGVKALTETIAYAKSKGKFVITDGKRNDIGATMTAYAAAHLGSTTVEEETFEPFGADALTVNGYLGTDGIQPLLEVCGKGDKGIFVLVKTSNPSSGELQDKPLADGNTVYRAMGAMCEGWGEKLPGQYGYSGVGAVVGATYPAQLEELRAAMPHTFFLVPGYGAQGGAADDVAPGFDKNGLGAIVNSSRGIMCAWQKEGIDGQDYAAAARREAIRMRDEIVGHIVKCQCNLFYSTCFLCIHALCIYQMIDTDPTGSGGNYQYRQCQIHPYQCFSDSTHFTPLLFCSPDNICSNCISYYVRLEPFQAVAGFALAVSSPSVRSIRMVSPSLTLSARINFAANVSTYFCRKRFSGLAPYTGS